MTSRPTRRSDNGFSFIELLAYMAIAALLILAAIPQFNGYRAKAIVSNMRDTAHNAALAAEAANIGTVSHRSGTGGIRLASAKAKLVATSSNFDAIQNAVDSVKTNDGERLDVTDEGSGDYVIAVTSSKAAATTKVIYASTYATTDGIDVTPGTSTIVDGKVVGQEPSAGGSTTPEAPTGLANAATCTADHNEPVPTAATIDLDQNVISTSTGGWASNWTAAYRYSDAENYRFGRSEYGDGNQGGATNAKMWIGSQQVCDYADNNLWITQDPGPWIDGVRQIHSLSLTFNNAGTALNLFTEAQATAHEDVTLAFDFKGQHYVVKVKWNSSWNQDGTQRVPGPDTGAPVDEGPM